MAKYIEIKGHSIQTTDTDPVVYAGTWASGNAANTARAFVSAAGTQTSGMLIGGLEPPQTGKTETYDGSSWSEVSDLNQVRHVHSSFGANSTTALAFGGDPAPGANPALNNTEIWDGSSWSEVNELNTARITMGSCGITTAGITFAGGFGGVKSEVESWDGTSWTEITEMNTSREYVAGSGTQTAALAIAGYTTTHVDEVESWNGTAWSEQSDVNTARYDNGAAQNAPNSNTITFAGLSGSTRHAQTESWDGSSWTEVADLGTARDGGEGAGSQTAALMIAGSLPSFTGATEEWSFPSTPAVQLGQVWFNTASVTLKGYAAQGTGAWASGNNLNSAHSEKPGGVGTQTASLCFAGNPYIQTNEEYDGTSWTEKGDLNTGRMRLAASKAGTVTAALAIAGEVPPNSDTVNVESWNGSAWTEIANVNTARRLLGGAGTQTSAIGFAGTTAHPAATGETAIAEEWNGSAWSEVGDLNTARFGLASAGENAENALAISGNTGSITAVVEKWDGTSWTEVGDVNTGRDGRAGAGIATAALGFGGYNPGNTVNTETWNGSSWTEVANLSTATNSASGTGAGNTTALNSGGNADTDGTEEWTVPGATKTLTVS